MKKRVFRDMDNSVFRVVISTEDWSEGDIELMCRFGEPEINVGGTVEYSYGGMLKQKVLGDEYVRVLHGFPYSRGFDSRDYESAEEAMAIGNSWKELVLCKIDDAVIGMRNNVSTLPTEEVSEI